MGQGFHTIETSLGVGQASHALGVEQRDHALGVEQRGHSPVASPRFALRVEQGMITTILDPGVEAIRHPDVGVTHVTGVEQDTFVLRAEHPVKQ